MFTPSKRILRQGITNFQRQGSLTAAAVLILIMTLALIGLLFVLRGIAVYAIDLVKERVDVSLYFKENASEEDIFAVQEELKKLSEIKEITYVSPDQALKRFQERYQEDPVITESLLEVGRNPFLAALNIKVWEAPQYESVVNFIEASTFSNLIEKVDYHQNKTVIDRLFAIERGVIRWGIVAGSLLGLMALLIIFNTIRLAIANSQKEIEVMRLVGADRWFVSGPFMVQGALIGLIAVFITVLLIGILSFAVTSQVESFVPGFNLSSYFVSNFWTLLLLQLAVGVGLGVFSAWFAVRKYLK